MPRRRLTRLGAVRGLLGGSKAWFGVWVVAGGFRMLAKVFREEPEVVYSEDLGPGESLVITHLTHHVG
jgi:hypothetical protein